MLQMLSATNSFTFQVGTHCSSGTKYKNLPSNMYTVYEIKIVILMDCIVYIVEFTCAYCFSICRLPNSMLTRFLSRIFLYIAVCIMNYMYVYFSI